MRPNWIEVLDDETPELDAAVHRMTNLPIAQRKNKADDLGAVMGVAHAVVKADAGEHVIVIIDDQAGALIATAETRRLERLGVGAADPDSEIVITSPRPSAPTGRIDHDRQYGHNPQKAAGGDYVPDRPRGGRSIRSCDGCDGGLLPIEMAPLLSHRFGLEPHHMFPSPAPICTLAPNLH